ncbi:CRISPR-associated protein, Cmr4 family [Thiothrix caldifontis]|uniref:CRISPR-associated protein, Cmr4 family n=1 Tax=Thiothrix caldifontis TaxID=525918 RepID=A0A1H4EKV3_9GAMM|nr:type III-B CRISPR module RAMP protein Cmr4 [Thiothrix caldifontis]SEA85200.1 CRISPR-associated protein, Cmr4 family [Thiothrix caldifontis]
MFEQSRLLFLYAVTPVHMGAGQAIGVIDNPIQRERHTNHPNMAGSGLKGAIRHHLDTSWEKPLVNRIFGPETDSSDYAGAVSFGDAQLVAFPVRSLKQAFVYAVSPVTLARLKRLATLAKVNADWNVPSVESDKCCVTDKRVLSNGKLVLEAFEYDVEDSASTVLKTVAAWLADNALPQDAAHQYFRDKIKTDLVLLPDDAFSHFVENATVVEPHVRIDDESGTAADGGLFYTENLPPESLLIAPVFASIERFAKDKKPEAHMDAEQVMGKLADSLDKQLVQVGGDATTGRGQVVLHFAGEAKQ